MMGHTLSAIIKVSGSCNLRCRYCYYPNTSRLRVLDKDLLKKFLLQAASLYKQVHLIWHGGEPLLAGYDFFEEILQWQQEIALSKGTKFQNSLQTNGTLINQKWASILKNGHFKVGVSLDGPRFIHDALRVSSSGRGSFSDVMQGVNILREAEIEFGVLAVVTRQSLNYADEIFSFFVENGIKSFDFLPLVKGSSDIDKDLVLQPGDFYKFMARVFDLWFALDDPEVEIRYLSQMILGLLGGMPTLCKFLGNCGEYITLEPDGSVFPCDSFPMEEALRFGDIKTHSLIEILKGSKYRRFMIKVSNLPQECIQCKYRYICNGGCRAYRYLQQKDAKVNYPCPDRKLLFSHIAGRLREEYPEFPLLEVVDVIER